MALCNVATRMASISLSSPAVISTIRSLFTLSTDRGFAISTEVIKRCEELMIDNQTASGTVFYNFIAMYLNILSVFSLPLNSQTIFK